MMQWVALSRTGMPTAKARARQQSSEVVSRGGEDGVGRIALLAGEVIAAHAMLAFGVADDRLDSRGDDAVRA